MTNIHYMYNLLIIMLINTACRLLPLPLQGTHRRSNLGNREDLSLFNDLVGGWIGGN